MIPEEEYYKSLPKKRMAAGALFFNEQGELLILKPSYKEGWTIPGGVVDENESVHAACVREIKEEIGLDIPRLQFLSVDYRPCFKGRGDNLQFIFYGGSLTFGQIESISLDEKEIVAFRFMEPKEAVSCFSKRTGDRISHSLKALRDNTALYLEAGVVI